MLVSLIVVCLDLVLQTAADHKVEDDQCKEVSRGCKVYVNKVPFVKTNPVEGGPVAGVDEEHQPEEANDSTFEFAIVEVWITQIGEPCSDLV